jgi:hypothetical protein
MIRAKWPVCDPGFPTGHKTMFSESQTRGTEMNATSVEAGVTRCRCGNDKTNPLVRPIKRYSYLGVMALLMGFTARPNRIDWVCSVCGTVIDSITDPQTLERFRYGEPGPYDK